MKTSITFLKYKESKEKTIKDIESTNANYIHVDVMDGIFVPPVVMEIDEAINLLKDCTKPLDIHLMVDNPRKYIESFINLNVEFLTFHIEIDKNIDELISLVKDNNKKVGLAINPNTSVDELKPYLNKLDNVLVMGVNPGYGGQPLIIDTIEKVKLLKELREINNYHYQISFDGGVNKDTRPLLNDVDILDIGSYVSMSDNFQDAIDSLR